MVGRAGELAVGVYLWHLTALSFCVGLIAAGIPAPTRLTTSWWSLRPVWWCAVLVVTAGLIVLVAMIRARLPRPSRLTARPFAASTGIVVITFAAALVGLRGPRSLPLALLCSLFFAGGWILLRVGSTPA